jgi:hypothetical protein
MQEGPIRVAQGFAGMLRFRGELYLASFGSLAAERLIRVPLMKV